MTFKHLGRHAYKKGNTTCKRYSDCGLSCIRVCLSAHYSSFRTLRVATARALSATEHPVANNGLQNPVIWGTGNGGGGGRAHVRCGVLRFYRMTRGFNVNDSAKLQVAVAWNRLSRARRTGSLRTGAGGPPDLLVFVGCETPP